MKINGGTFYLWRAADHEGEVLKAFVTKKRDRKAALKFLRKAMKRYGGPEIIVTDRLRSYRAAIRQRGAPEDEALAQQPDRKFTPAIPTTRASDGEVSKRQIATEIRLNPFFNPQPFQPRMPSLQPRKLQDQPIGRACRVASTHGLSLGPNVFCRSFRFRLTSPTRLVRLRVYDNGQFRREGLDLDQLAR